MRVCSAFSSMILVAAIPDFRWVLCVFGLTLFILIDRVENQRQQYKFWRDVISALSSVEQKPTTRNVAQETDSPETPVAPRSDLHD